MNATHIKVYPSRRTHFQHCYNKYSKLCNTDVPQRVFPHGEKASSSLVITCLKNKLCFQICPVTHPRKPRKPQIGKHKPGRCGTLIPGAIHTTKQAGSPPDSGIFSRPEFTAMGFPIAHGFGAGSAYPQGWQHNLFCVDIPSPTFWRIQPSGGFQLNKQPETMTKVPSPHTSSLDIPRQQAAIENALSMALYFMRLPRTDSALHAATAKTNRALTLLKNACSDAQNGGAV